MSEKKSEFVLPSIPDQRAAGALTKPLLQTASAYVIKSEDHYIASWPIIERHDVAIKKIGEMFDPFVAGLHALHKMAIGLRDQFLQPVVDSKNALLKQRKEWREAKERENKRLADAAAEALRKTQAKQLVSDAKKLEKTGDTEAATVLREQAATLPVPVIPVAPPAPKQEGSVITKRWKFTIDNPDLVPREYCVPDPKTIRKVVDGLGDKANIPGVTVTQDTSESSRARA